MHFLGIRSKLLIVMAVGVLGILATIGVATSQLRASIAQERLDQTEAVVETAYGIIEG